jgi:hypothetical protein
MIGKRRIDTMGNGLIDRDDSAVNTAL